MPELPEVETMVRGIRSQAEGAAIAGLFKCRCACKPIDIRPGWPTIQKKAKGQHNCFGPPIGEAGGAGTLVGRCVCD